MIDNYIMDQSPRITMTLSEILANTPPVQTLAQATDVPGTNLEWMKTVAYLTGAWFGDLGELGTTGFRDSLFTGYLARGVTCKVSGVPYSWSGSAWAAVGSSTPTQTRLGNNRMLGVTSGQNNAPGYTLIQTLQGPKNGFGGLRFVFENHDTTRAANIDLASVAAVPTKNANGPYASAKNLTFSGLRAGVIPAATAGSTGNGNIPGMLVSDPVSIDSVPRTDGGTIPMIAIRVMTSSVNVAPKIPKQTWESAFASLPSWEGQYTELSPAQNATGSGDWVTGQPSISGFSPTWHNYWLVQIGYSIFFAKGEQKKNWVGFGDSIMIGQASERGCSGPVIKMCESFGDSAMNFASGGQKYIDTCAIIRAVEPTLARNSVVAMFAASPNDGGTQDLWDASYAMMLDNYDFLVGKGHTPVVFTSVPWNGNSVVTVCRARLLASGLRVFDAYASINDPANPNHFLPAYDSGDHLHPSEAGNAKMASDLAAWRTANNL